MNRNRDNLIAGLTAELAPVRSFSMRDGARLVAAAAAVTLVVIALIEGLWVGAFLGEAAPFFWIITGLLLVLGLASAGAAISLASPAVGNRYDAPKWAAAMLGVLPLAALIDINSHGIASEGLFDLSALHCFAFALFASLFTGGGLTLWLRRGAPVSLEASGWFTGIAAGALGTMIYGFSCPIDNVAHLGIWHVMPVAAAALIGRLTVPALVRW